MDRPILCVAPGSATSTKDVYDGIVGGLIACGAKVVEYALGQRLVASRRLLLSAYRRQVKQGGPMKDVPPTDEDTLYLAGQGVLERALQADAKWVLVVAGGNLHPAVLTLLRRAGRKIAVLLTESSYWDDWQQQFVRQADVCWTNEHSSVETIRQGCPWTFYLPTAFNPTQHHPATGEEAMADTPSHDVVLVGTGFQERIELLSQIDWTGIDLGLYGLWGLLPSRHRLRRFVRDTTIANTQAVALYRKAKIGLNLYRTSVGFGRNAPRIAQAESLNPRAYELAACGVFQVSEYRPEVEDVFGESVPCFSTAASAELLIRVFLRQKEERDRLAAQARERVQPHTYVARAQQVLAHLESFEKAEGAGDALLRFRAQQSDPAPTMREEREGASVPITA